MTTPISFLQEFLVKQGDFPTYNYIGLDNNGVDTFFMYEVRCKTLSAKGTGHTKKSAKHDAANNMLLLFNMKDKVQKFCSTYPSSEFSIIDNTTRFTPKQEIPTLESKNPTFINYVGLLQEFCIQHKQNVSYEVIEESGPPHLKIFTMQAKTKSLQRKGIAYSKKLAKQKAAELLLQDLKNLSEFTQTDVLIQEDDSIDSQRTFENDAQELIVAKCESALSITELTDKAQSAYIMLTKTNNKARDYLQSYQIKDYHTLFKRMYFTKISSSMIENMKMICDEYTKQIDKIPKMLEDIQDVLEVELEEISKNNLGKKHMICLRLTSQPHITQFGIGTTNDMAKIHAMYNIITSILTFLS